MHTQFNLQSRYRQRAAVRPLVLIVAILVVVVAILMIRSASSERQLPRKQAELLEAIQKRSRSGVEKLLADDYRDRWGFDKEDAIVSLLDVGSQFFAVVIVAEDQQVTIDGEAKTALVSARLKLNGNGTPIAQEVMRRCNRLESPFTFTWKKQSWWPWSWRATAVDQPELPDDLHGYEPGDIRRAMEME